MSDLHPELPDGSENGSVARNAKIEELLLVGLDQYFAGHYEQAINVWTRVLFLDRGHARARAYIERARSAIAERHRESEELLQAGIAAFEKGDVDRARQLIDTSIERGGPSDVAVALLSRLSRRDVAGADQSRDVPILVSPRAPAPGVRAVRAAAPWRMASLVAAVTLLAGVAGIALSRGSFAWTTTRTESPRGPAGAARPEPVPVPRAGEEALARARALYRRGHLNEALVELAQIRAADRLRADADRLEAEVQRALIEAASLAPSRRSRPPNP